MAIPSCQSQEPGSPDAAVVLLRRKLPIGIQTGNCNVVGFERQTLQFNRDQGAECQ